MGERPVRKYDRQDSLGLLAIEPERSCDVRELDVERWEAGGCACGNRHEVGVDRLLARRRGKLRAGISERRLGGSVVLGGAANSGQETVPPVAMQGNVQDELESIAGLGTRDGVRRERELAVVTDYDLEGLLAKDGTGRSEGSNGSGETHDKWSRRVRTQTI